MIFITPDEFESLQAMGRPYEGFIIGVGYAYTQFFATPPPNLKGSIYPRDNSVRPEMNRFTTYTGQCIDTSPEMVRLSMRTNTAGTFSEYIVMRGETLSGIAKELGITVEDLIRWNKIQNPDDIKQGQTLMIDNTKAQPGWQFKISVEQNVRSRENRQNTGATKKLVGLFNASGLIFSTVGGLKYTKDIWDGFGGFWRGVNGNYYSMTELKKGYAFQNSFNKATVAQPFKFLRWGGGVIGGATTMYSLSKFLMNPNWEDGLDTAFGAAGLAYWPIGVGYFAINLSVRGMNNYTQSMLDRGLNPMLLWKQ